MPTIEMHYVNMGITVTSITVTVTVMGRIVTVTSMTAHTSHLVL